MQPPLGKSPVAVAFVIAPALPDGDKIPANCDKTNIVSRGSITGLFHTPLSFLLSNGGLCTVKVGDFVCYNFVNFVIFSIFA